MPFTSSFNSKNIGVSAIHFICSGVLSSPLHVHCGPMLFATSALEHCALCYTCRHRALFSSLGHPMQKTSECLHSTLFVVEHYGSGALCSLLYLNWSTVLSTLCALEHCPLHYMCTRALSSLLQCTGALSSPLQCTRAVSTILSTTVSP